MTPSHYPDEGNVTGYRCPRCGSTSILCDLAVFEFTSLRCLECGHHATLDDYQIERWFDPDSG